MSQLPSFVLAATALFFSGLGAAVASGQESAPLPPKKMRCTVCGHDPELLKVAKIHHGPFEFARSNTTKIKDEFTWAPIWIETEHFRIGGEFPKWKIPIKEIKAYRKELSKLEELFPEFVAQKTKVLDPWLRLHLIALRMEEFYRITVESFGADLSIFGDTPEHHLRGRGLYLGETNKYEVLVFEDKITYREFMTLTWGLAYVKPQRWNNPERDCLWYGLNLQEDEVQHDQHLHNLLLHGIAHNLMDGYMHYSFELPVWIREGFAHWAEQRNDPRFNTFCTVEGSLHEGKELARWAPAVKKMVQRDEATSFASLLRRTSYAELGWEDHLVAWSKMDFLLSAKPIEFGQFLTALCSKVDDKGLPDGSNLGDAQRTGFQEAFGWSVLKAEKEWQAWVLEHYPSK